MFNARHILLKPEYTSEDRQKGFRVLDSLKTELKNDAVTFELAARFYSEDPATRTNGGQMADPMTGSSYFEIDQLKPQDYAAIKNLKEGDISDPFESLDNEGRDGNLVYKLVKVDKIIPSHPATFSNDYTLMLQNARAELQEKAINDFITEKIKTTYIIIDPLFKDCDFEKEGWSEKFRK
jgi:peptidyl-prolyl cis-trans isomerase SurA